MREEGEERRLLDVSLSTSCGGGLVVGLHEPGQERF